MYSYMNEIKKYINTDSNTPLNDVIYNGLRTVIIKGIIPVGERINEKYYSEFLNISRTPIRNAIEKLKQEGIVEHIPNYGVVVKRIRVEDAEEIYKIRTALEKLATITAMNNMSDEDFMKVKNLIKVTFEENQKGNVKRVIELSSTFNSMIFEYAKMPRLEIIIKNLNDYLARFRNISLYDDKRRLEAIQEHDEILETMELKDEPKIRKLIEDHLNYSRDFIISEINRLEREREEFFKNKDNL